MDYTEEIYERAERMFSGIDNQISWLDSFENPERGETKYTKQAVKVRDNLVIVRDIEKEVDTIDNYDSLEKTKIRVNDINISSLKSDALNSLKNKELELDKVEIEQQEEFRAEAEALKYTYNNPSSPEEKEEVLEQLRELDSNIARTVKGWETRRRNQTERLAKI